MTSKKHDIRLVLHTRKDSLPDVLAITLRVVEVTEKREVLNPVYSAYGDDNFDKLDDLVISAQANTEDNDGSFYGWSVDYRQPYNVSLDRAKDMVKVLTKIDRHLTKLSARFGAPQDFAEYAGRVADALGANNSGQSFGVQVTPDRDYDGTGYRWTAVDGLRYQLNDALKVARG